MDVEHFHGLSWISWIIMYLMDFHGFCWPGLKTDVHGCSRMFTVRHGNRVPRINGWTRMDDGCGAFSWIIMDFMDYHGFSWISMDFMDYHVFSWISMGSAGQS